MEQCFSCRSDRFGRLFSVAHNKVTMQTVSCEPVSKIELLSKENLYIYVLFTVWKLERFLLESNILPMLLFVPFTWNYLSADDKLPANECRREKRWHEACVDRKSHHRIDSTTSNLSIEHSNIDVLCACVAQNRTESKRIYYSECLVDWHCGCLCQVVTHTQPFLYSFFVTLA